MSNASLTITIYDRPNCVACRSVERKLTKEGIPFTVSPLSDNEDVVKRLTEKGFTSAPGVVLEHGGEVVHEFGGYIPDHLKTLIRTYRELA